MGSVKAIAGVKVREGENRKRGQIRSREDRLVNEKSVQDVGCTPEDFYGNICKTELRLLSRIRDAEESVAIERRRSSGEKRKDERRDYSRRGENSREQGSKRTEEGGIEEPARVARI